MSSGDRFPGYKRAPSYSGNTQSTMGGRADPVATSDDDDSSLIGLLKRLLSVKLPLKLTTEGRFDTEAFVPSIGKKGDTVATSDTEEFSLISLVKRILSRLTTLLPQASGRLAVDAVVPALGATNDIAATSDNGSATLVSLVKRLLQRLTTLLPQVSGRLAVDASPNIGSTADVAASSDTGDFTLIALLKRLLARLTIVLPQVNGRLAVNAVTIPYATSELWFQNTTSAITTTADTVIAPSSGTGVRNYITSLVLVNNSATGVTVEIKDGTTVISRFFVKANDSLPVAFSGFLKGSANTAISAAPTTAGATIFITAIGFQAP